MTFADGYLVDDQMKIAHPLTGQSTRLGRDSSNDILVRDPTASRFHAEVRREGGSFTLQSMGASGTTLNDKPLTSPTKLADGDLIEIAFTRLRFTTGPLGPGISVASAHSPKNDETARKPTLGAGVDVVSESNTAGQHTRRVQLLVLVIIIAIAIWWFGRGTG